MKKLLTIISRYEKLTKEYEILVKQALTTNLKMLDQISLLKMELSLYKQEESL